MSIYTSNILVNAYVVYHRFADTLSRCVINTYSSRWGVLVAQRPYTVIIASIFITSLCCIGIKDIRLVNELRSVSYTDMKHEATKCGYLQTVALFRIRLGLIKTLKELVNEGNH